MSAVAGAHLRGVCAKVLWVPRAGAPVGVITEPAPMRQILDHIGEPTSAPSIAIARVPLPAINGQQQTAREAIFETIT